MVVFESDRCETMSCYPQHVCVYVSCPGDVFHTAGVHFTEKTEQN